MQQDLNERQAKIAKFQKRLDQAMRTIDEKDEVIKNMMGEIQDAQQAQQQAEALQQQQQAEVESQQQQLEALQQQQEQIVATPAAGGWQGWQDPLPPGSRAPFQHIPTIPSYSITF